MDITTLYDLGESYRKQGILICFAGPFSHSIIEELGTAVKCYLEEANLTKGSMMDVFSIFIEQTQNVRNYAARKTAEGNRDHDFGQGIVIIGREGDCYTVSSGNTVARADIERAVAKLERLRGLDKQGLKAAFKEQMRNASGASAGGGLGLIDMARKASAPLEYSVRELDERYCFFSLKATV